MVVQAPCCSPSCSGQLEQWTAGSLTPPLEGVVPMGKGICTNGEGQGHMALRAWHVADGSLPFLPKPAGSFLVGDPPPPPPPPSSAGSEGWWGRTRSWRLESLCIPVAPTGLSGVTPLELKSSAQRRCLIKAQG